MESNYQKNTYYIRFEIKYLEIAHFRNDPLVDKLLRILGEAQEELAIGLHGVDVIDCFMDLGIEALDFLLTRCAQQEVIHLRFQRVINLHILFH